MKIVVLADDDAFETIRLTNTQAIWIQVADANSFTQHDEADAFFDLTYHAITTQHPVLNKPLFINSVIYSLPAGKKAIRINGWKGFLENNLWEVSGDISTADQSILSYLNKKIIVCNDEPGFVSPRIIAMIINEAYYAKGEGVSTEEEIDIAMKLGTNYPYGPFEWAHKIGVDHIYNLLKKLSLSDSRYQPSPLLTKTATS